MKSPFEDYDEFASDVIDDACRFLVRKKTFTSAQVDTLPLSKLWREATSRGWKSPEKP